jgi:hypothetical protein
MISKDPSRSPKKKKSVRKKKSGAPVSISEVVADLRHQMDSRWPNLGRRLASVIRVSREKLDDIYCSAAQFVTEHKEAFDDRRAEKKAQDRTAGLATHQPGTPVHPARASRNPAGKGTVRRSVRPSSVKKPKNPQQNRLPETQCRL